MQKCQFTGGNLRPLELELPLSMLPGENSALIVCFAKADFLYLITWLLL